MDQANELKKINGILICITQVIETKLCNKRQLIYFKELIRKVHEIQNKDILQTCYNNRGIDFIYLICRHNRKKLLRYLLNESHVLHYFTIDNKTTESEYRENTLYYAICSNQFKMIEMLYDHWTGDLHWSGHKEYNSFDVSNLSQLNNLLKSALERYENRILSQVNRNIDQTMMFNVQSLIALSEFRIELYTKLNKLKESMTKTKDDPADIIRLRETDAIRNMILSMIECYEIHTKKLGSIIQNSVYENKNEFGELSEYLESPKDTSELQRRTYLNVLFEVYFRKLDYNVCLLILDNLHPLKIRLTMHEDSYQRLENEIYRFVYHVSSQWNLYIPNKRNIECKEISGHHKNIDVLFSIKYNADTFERGLNIIYLERREFENALNDFKNQLQNRDIEENIRNEKMKLPNEETNTLTLLPELRDIYSLKRIARQIAQLYSANIKYTRKYICLLVQRTLQVVGEFLKSTNETLHLQPTTEALAEAEISVDIVNDLKSLRDFLCHVKDGELLKRIEMETNSNDIFINILQELKLLKKKIDDVVMICKPLVEKALISHGLSLIEKRRNEMPDEVAKDWFNKIKHMRLLPQPPHYELFWATKGYADEYATEVIMLVEHSLQLEIKFRIVVENIRENLIQKMSIYKFAVNNSLQKICEVKNKWQEIVKFLKNKIPSIILSNVPNENDTNRIRTYSNKVDLPDHLNRFIQDNKLFAYAEIHCKFLKKLLGFIILKTESLHLTPIEKENITVKLQSLSYSDNDMKRVVSDFLGLIEQNLAPDPNIKYQNHSLEFIGIKRLRRIFSKPNFLIYEEKKHLNETLEKIAKESNAKRKQKIQKMINKINENEAIPKTEFTNFISVLNLDRKSEKYLMNLVMGYKRDPLHPWCLSKRICQLKEITKGQSVNQLITRYKLDKVFHVVIEVLVFDVFAILECTKNNDIVKKTGKLLTETNLRNFLIHGNPLLEVVGDVLDSNDLPMELIDKALALLEEEKSIHALCALRDLDFDFSEINSNLLSTDIQSLVIEFKSSTRWKEYLNLNSRTEAGKNVLKSRKSF